MLPTNHSYSSWPLSHTFPSLLLPHQITQRTFPLTPQLTERIQTTGNKLPQYPTTSCSTVACSIERMSCVEHLSVKGMPVSHRGRWGLSSLHCSARHQHLCSYRILIAHLHWLGCKSALPCCERTLDKGRPKADRCV